MVFKIFLNPPGELERGFESLKGQDSHGLSFPTEISPQVISL